MKNFNKISLFSLLIAVFILACNKDETITTTTTIPPIPEMLVTASLIGEVIDETGLPVEGASVKVGNNEFTTDENGVFITTDILMNEFGTYIKVEKDGYFLGAKFVEPSLNKQAYTKIRLLEKTVIGEVEASVGGIISTADGARITFPNNGIQTAGGELYSGTVEVAAKWLNPKDVHIGEIMPGDLRGLNTDQEIMQLATYGMIAVELESPTGAALNIANGKKATIELPVPAELINGAPSTIPLWHFNETTGYWEEDGTAILQGDKYVGEVGHFSFWNCDDGFPYTELSGNIVDANGNPVAFHSIFATINSSALTASTHTDADGNFSGKVPQDEVLTLEIFDHCGDAIYSEEIGPFAEDVTVLPTITLPNTTYFFDFAATLVDCDGNPVTFGYAKIKIDDWTFYNSTDENGLVTLTLNNCDEEQFGSVTGYDLTNLKESLPSPFDINGQSSVDAGIVEVCDELTEHITFTMDGITRVITDPYYYPVNAAGVESPTIGGFRIDTNEVIIRFPVAITNGGNFTPENMIITMNPVVTPYVTAHCENFCNGISVNISNFDAVEGIIEGTFIGLLNDSDTAQVLDVEGSFRVKID